MASSHDFVQAASHKRAFLKKQADALETQAREFDAEVERLRRLRAENRQELAGYLLAEVDDDAIKALEERLRFPALAPIKAEFEAELEAAQSELAALEANPTAYIAAVISLPKGTSRVSQPNCTPPSRSCSAKVVPL